MPDTIPTTTPKPAAPRASRALQDQVIQNYLIEARSFLQTASTDPEIRPVLETHGYDDAEFALGFALAKTALDAFGTRQTGAGAQDQASGDLQTAIAAAREDYAAFREIARGVFPRQEDRVTLALTGTVPHDFQKFVTLAHTSYANAGHAPHAARLAKRGYPAARLSTLLASLEALVTTGSGQDEAQGDAIGSTAARDQAYEKLKEYMKELKAVARGALRGKAGAMNKLKL